MGSKPKARSIRYRGPFTVIVLDRKKVEIARGLFNMVEWEETASYEHVDEGYYYKPQVVSVHRILTAHHSEPTKKGKRA